MRLLRLRRWTEKKRAEHRLTRFCILYTFHFCILSSLVFPSTCQTTAWCHSASHEWLREGERKKKPRRDGEPSGPESVTIPQQAQRIGHLQAGLLTVQFCLRPAWYTHLEFSVSQTFTFMG